MESNNAQWRARLIAICQSEVEESIISIGILQPAGSTVSGALVLVPPLASFLRRRAGKQSAPGFPRFGLCAATDRRLLVFEARPSRRTWKVKQLALEFPRDTLEVTIDKTGVTRLVTLIDVHGIRFTVESPKLVDRGFNDQLLVVLTSGAKGSTTLAAYVVNRHR